jgi:ketosteroid isomerase-like protein
MGQARETVERFYERFSAGDLDGAMEVYAEGCVSVTPGGALPNAEHRAFGKAFMTALPDAHMEPVRVVESGDEVVVNGRFKGTHRGDLQAPQGTIPASGNTIDAPFMDYFRVENGRVVEHEVIWDQMAMLGQLGALSAPA